MTTENQARLAWTIGICGCAIPKSGCQPVDLPSRCENCGGEIPALRPAKIIENTILNAATRETRGTAPQPDAHRTLQTIFNELNDPESGESERWVKIEEVLHQYFRATEPVAPPLPIDEERFRRIVKFLSENEAFCQVTPTNGTPWGFGLGEATQTFTLYTCKNGCGLYVKNQGDECLSCSAKWLVEQINKLRAGTHPPQEGA